MHINDYKLKTDKTFTYNLLSIQQYEVTEYIRERDRQTDTRNSEDRCMEKQG